MPKDYEIEFEDLHGVPDGSAVEVDLDADSEGVRRVPAHEAGSDDAGKTSGDGTPPKKAGAGPKEDGEDGDGKFSKKFRTRLSREQRAKERERDARKKAEQRADALETRINKLEKTRSKDELDEIERTLSDTETQLETAIEKGDTKTQLKLTRKMTDLQAELKVSKKAAEIMAESDDSTQGQGTKPSGNSNENPVAEEWMDSHSDWYGMKGFERQTRLVNRLDKEIFKDGYDPQTDEYFEELDRRLKDKAPELFDEEPAQAPSSKRNRGQPPVAPTGSGEDRTSSATTGLGSKVTLTEEDFRVMRQFNLNTNDPETLKEFARNKREAEAQEATR